ncbi:hypothetical protein SISNIDRAFT_484427 [Sistotremastrum niveocremeum HHB9708]|uniref:F-box domain-containing protein n=1 Tax=Sistotremastrum niveocremeum HHB9708 TaxID=1314777 RepID=A0A164WBI9_9AGAM|nr:hypothetical protein SISNIDRAFT_484427 [Sistotremastrum niveocremeum HHB9708]
MDRATRSSRRSQRSASAAVWAIPELASLIVSECPQSTTAGLARVNTLISDIALASLYRSVFRNLPNLLAILAPMEPCAEPESGLTFVRPLEKSDWTRFLKYTAFVKEISFFSTYGRPNAPRAIAPVTFAVMIATRPVDTIFPVLECFTAWHPLGPLHPFYQLIFQKRLTSLSVFWEPSLRLFQNMRAIADSIQKLTIYGSPTSMDSLTSKELLALIPELRSLVTLRLPSIFINSDIFEMLSFQEHLECLVMKPNSTEVSISVTGYSFRFVEGRFPSLKEISMEDGSDRPHKRLSIQTPNLTLESLSVSLLGRVALSSIRKYTVTLGAGFPSLQTLHLDVTTPFQDQEQVIDSFKTFTVFQPLLSLTQLRDLAITSESPISFADEHIEQMAQAWTHIIHFRLECETPYESNETELTLSCLISFTEHCPSLKCLTLAVDASLVPPRPVTDSTSFSNSLNLLDLSGSLAGDTMAVSCYIADLLPNDDRIFHYRTYHHGQNELLRIQKWTDVHDTVLKMTKVRSRGLRRALIRAPSMDS